MEATVLRYRVMAYVTGVVLVVLCFVGIPLQGTVESLNVSVATGICLYATRRARLLASR